MNIQMFSFRDCCSVITLLSALLLVPVANGVCQDKEGSKVDSKPKKSKVRLVTSLSNVDARKFRFGERLQTKVPEANKDSVGALLLRREDRLTDAPATVSAKTLYQKGKLYVEVDSSTIAQMAYQPLEIKIDQAGINRVIFIAVADDSEKAKKTEAFQANCFLLLDPPLELDAEIDESQKIEIKSEIGDVSVALSAIEAVLFSNQPGIASTFVFKNGDKITGQAKLEGKIEVGTKWGKADLDAKRILTLTRDKSARFIRGTGATKDQFFLTKPENKPPAPSRQRDR